jgi:hypothetical protein
MHRTLFTIPGFFSTTECRAVIETAERLGFEAAPITTARGFVMAPDVRNNTRVMFDDETLAAGLWKRLEARIAGSAAWSPIGLNERFRIYRYDPEQAFRWHRDGAFVRSDDERSFLTFMVYLNGGFDGGATEFEDETVVPAEGLGVVFSHGLRHQGAEVASGRKYVLRTDIMFRRAPA